MTGDPNPGTKTAADRDYEKKFNSRESKKHAGNLKNLEESPGAEWKTSVKKKQGEKTKSPKRRRFGFAGRRAGAIQNGSAIAFIVAILFGGVWYTSIFAPNIILVNIKEMYTNDLADATFALDVYYRKMLSYKIGRSNCGEQDSIKCKLSTMSRAQKQAFEKQGFTVLGSKLQEDNRDNTMLDQKESESRYQVSAVIPPTHMTGGVPVPIPMGDALWAYAALSSQTESNAFAVFNPKTSFFHDARFQQRLRTQYDLTKQPIVSGQTESAVNRSFDASMTGGAEGIGMDFKPNSTGGIGLGGLRNPMVLANIEAGMLTLTTTQTNSFVGLQCNWYAFGKAMTNNLITAKTHTIARFAMNYLKAADQIKSGTSQDITISTLASKLTQGTFGGYNSANATDDSMYKHITYGGLDNLPIPSIYGFLYYLDALVPQGAMMPAWLLIMGSAAQQGQVSGVQGSLSMPPFGSLGDDDRQYCLGGETELNHIPIKLDHCQKAVGASSPFGPAVVQHAIELGWETCPNFHKDERDPDPFHYHGEFLTQPALKATAETLSPMIAGVFGVNAVAAANALYLLFNSNTKGVAASNAIFAGTGEILGDMAMSRGMMPSDARSMSGYLLSAKEREKDYERVARYDARKTPFDVYNKYSFLGSIVSNLNPTYNKNSTLFSTVANIADILGSAVKHVNKSANAKLGIQPDDFNPARMALCPDPEYWAIMIMADVGCNVRYSMGLQELSASVDDVLDYMTDTHSDLYQDGIEELTERLAQADHEGDAQNIGRMLAMRTAAAQLPMIDKKTGKAMPGTEYDMFLQYCVNRQDPWGRSGIHVIRTGLDDSEQRRRGADKDGNGNAVSTTDRGDPYAQTTIGFFPAVTEGASDDQDWYTGKKCTEQSDELKNFRAYTMMCSVDGSLSGAVDCTGSDNEYFSGYADPFYTSNNILYTSWN